MRGGTIRVDLDASKQRSKFLSHSSQTFVHSKLKYNDLTGTLYSPAQSCDFVDDVSEETL